MKSIIMFCGIMLTVYIAYRIYKYQTLDNGLDQLVRDGAVILDVRTEKEFKMGHISESKNFSLGTIRERYTELDPGKTYITVCSHGLRSVKVETILKEKGFKKVYNGGAWSDLKKKLDLKSSENQINTNN
ncbi:rhodanese-like domain-containing protein [Chryseobacterium chendengshani]|uniref:rhodanese-like domain-containing protein n=1 Tax=Chryseobacterium sp. LJ668 TaxID=2864040 RepID=UPI001C68B57E|nr:rhodanese-like domain-containing protein [Chryseobacterium sp. LJ668]MBW8522657.1 rhodanese-like domain-containing protein [Chryseobacterium sp. LJ668]QYK16194.1 rhodanese-like domain-containing protein [Chryseobacterium sp. LJ668]